MKRMRDAVLFLSDSALHSKRDERRDRKEQNRTIGGIWLSKHSRNTRYTWLESRAQSDERWTREQHHQRAKFVQRA